MKHVRWIPLALLLACPVALAFSYTREFLAVDVALDAGVSWDYHSGKADFTRSHTFIPFSARHGTLIAAARWSMLAAPIYGLMLALSSRRACVA